jgi:hypothetical protein
LYCSGTLINDATGLANFLASAAACSSWAQAGAASTKALVIAEKIHSLRLVTLNSR